MAKRAQGGSPTPQRLPELVPLAAATGPLSGAYGLNTTTFRWASTGPWGLTSGDVPFVLSVPLDAYPKAIDGSMRAHIYTNNAGVPGTLVQSSAAVPLADLESVPGGPYIGFVFPRTALATGNYHIALELIGTPSGGSTPEWSQTAAVSAVYTAHSADGASWTADSAEAKRPVLELLGTS